MVKKEVKEVKEVKAVKKEVKKEVKQEVKSIKQPPKIGLRDDREFVLPKSSHVYQE